MTDDQLATIRDELIAELATPKSSACKFEPALLDWRKANVQSVFIERADANPLKTQLSTVTTSAVISKVESWPTASDATTLDAAKSAVRAFTQANHQRAVANMAAEFSRPDMQAVYGGKKPEELQTLFITEQPITADFPIPSLMEEIIAQQLATLATIPADLAITKAGQVQSNHPWFQKMVDDAVAASGKKPEELTVARTETREIGKSPSPLARCWAGIPYTYNVPPIEVVQQALSGIDIAALPPVMSPPVMVQP